jgi:hypothetical protein
MFVTSALVPRHKIFVIPTLRNIQSQVQYSNKSEFRIRAAAAEPRYRYSVTLHTMPERSADGVATPDKIYFATGNNKKLQEVSFVWDSLVN